MPITRKEYLEKRAKIESDYKRQLKELEAGWRMFGEKDANEGDLKLPIPEDGTKSLKQMTLEAVSRQLAAFTIRNIRDDIQRHYPDYELRVPSLSTVLLRLAEGKEIQIAEEGRGRKATVYRKK